MKKKKCMSIMFVVRTKKTNYKFYCDGSNSQDKLFAECVAECIKYDIPFKTNVVIFGNDCKVVDCFGSKELFL